MPAVLRVNVLGAVACFEFARRCTPLARVMLVSSDAVLSAPEMGGAALSLGHGPHAEREGAVPTAYALSKIAAEGAARRWRELHGLDIVTVRFGEVYGRMDRDTGARNRHNAP